MELDQLLVHQIIHEDLKAFKQFFEGFYPSVCVFAHKYLKDIYVAEDLAQEAFIEFWKQKGNFHDMKTIKGFIYTVTRNKCLNHIKSTNIRQNIENNELSNNDYFYELILEEETYSYVYQSIEMLAPQSRKIVSLCLEGKKNQEIADQLNISINTVKTLKKNAYKELRVQLKDKLNFLLLISQLLN